MADSKKIKELVNRIPDLEAAPDSSSTNRNNRSERFRLGKLTGPDWNTAQEIFDPILAGGPDAILQVVDIIEADDNRSYKARYVLHGLTTYVARNGLDQSHRLLAQTLASQLGSNRDKSIQKILIQELQEFAGPEVVPQLGSVLTDGDLCSDAAQALTVIREEAATSLRQALPKANGRCRLAIIQALGELEDPDAYEAIRQASQDSDHDIRQTALWAMRQLSASMTVASDNQLTDAEKRAGWKLLFNGKDHSGWITNKGGPIQTPVEDGCLLPWKSGGYIIIHEQQWDNFILECDVRMTPPACNSGVFFRVGNLKNPVHSGFEIAINKGGKGLHSFGAIYDLVPARGSFLRGPNKFDTVQVKCVGPEIQIRVNGQLTAEMNCDEWPEKSKRPDGSKHKFRTAIKDLNRPGYLGFQDHGKKVWYKNVKLLELNPDGSTKV